MASIPPEATSTPEAAPSPPAPCAVRGPKRRPQTLAASMGSALTEAARKAREPHDAADQKERA